MASCVLLCHRLQFNFKQVFAFATFKMTRTTPRAVTNKWNKALSCFRWCKAQAMGGSVRHAATRKCCKSPKWCSIPKFVPVFIICMCLPCSPGLLGLFESSFSWLGSLQCSTCTSLLGRGGSSLFSSLIAQVLSFRSQACTFPLHTFFFLFFFPLPLWTVLPLFSCLS